MPLFGSPIVLPDDPTSANQAATKAYVDAGDSTSVKIGGDLSGTPTAPTVPGLANKLDVLGPLATKTASYTLTDSDAVIVANSTSAALTMTLPTAVGRAGRRFLVKKLGGNTANPVTIASNGGTIDGASAEVISVAGGFRELVSDGTNWQIIGGKVEPVIITATSPANGGTLTLDASVGSIYRVATSVAGFTLAPPSNPIDGDRVDVEIAPSVAFSLTIGTGTAPNTILLTTGITSPISVAAGKRWFGGLRYVSGVGWFLLASTAQS